MGNATCQDKECFCKDGGCAEKTGEHNNLACRHSAKCAAYAMCRQLNLEGDCCPTPGANGTHLECCYQLDEAASSAVRFCDVLYSALAACSALAVLSMW